MALPITTLEVVTRAYVACALASYISWWKAPQDVEQRLIVGLKNLTP
jgi:hypothetical protein